MFKTFSYEIKQLRSEGDANNLWQYNKDVPYFIIILTTYLSLKQSNISLVYRNQ